jgi:hypothetical protein
LHTQVAVVVAHMKLVHQVLLVLVVRAVEVMLEHLVTVLAHPLEMVLQELLIAAEVAAELPHYRQAINTPQLVATVVQE